MIKRVLVSITCILFILATHPITGQLSNFDTIYPVQQQNYTYALMMMNGLNYNMALSFPSPPQTPTQYILHRNTNEVRGSLSSKNAVILSFTYKSNSLSEYESVWTIPTLGNEKDMSGMYLELFERKVYCAVRTSQSNVTLITPAVTTASSVTCKVSGNNFDLMLVGQVLEGLIRTLPKGINSGYVSPGVINFSKVNVPAGYYLKIGASCSLGPATLYVKANDLATTTIYDDVKEMTRNTVTYYYYLLGTSNSATTVYLTVLGDASYSLDINFVQSISVAEPDYNGYIIGIVLLSLLVAACCITTVGMGVYLVKNRNRTRYSGM